MKKKKKKNFRPALFILIAAAFMTFAAVFFVLMFIIDFSPLDTSYEGPSDRQMPEMNIYDTEAFYRKNGLLYYKDDNYRSRAGIDVSTYQKEIDWKKVYKAGIRFAMIRVGYSGRKTGKIRKDKRFEENIAGAADAGIDTGVYFFSQAKTRKEAMKEARFVVRQLKGKNITYPVAFDMEDTREHDRHEDLSREDRTVIADAFCQVISKNGYEPMIYAYPDWVYNKIDYTILTRYDMWLAHYTRRSSYPFHYRIWQYSSKGKIPGIQTKTDLDIIFIRK